MQISLINNATDKFGDLNVGTFFTLNNQRFVFVKVSSDSALLLGDKELTIFTNEEEKVIVIRNAEIRIEL